MSDKKKYPRAEAISVAAVVKPVVSFSDILHPTSIRSLEQEEAAWEAKPRRHTGSNKRTLSEFIYHIESGVTIDALKNCWNWNGSRDKDGYARTIWLKKHRKLSRFVLFLVSGKELTTAELACHTCDNPKCINPQHLYRGTYSTNNNDCVNRGRHVSGDLSGENGPNAKLTNTQVEAIRARRKSGALLREIAAEFKTTAATISDICLRNTWKNVA